MPALKVKIFAKYSTSKWEDAPPDKKGTTFTHADREDLNVSMVGPGLDRLIRCKTRKGDSTAALAINGHEKAQRLWLYGRIEYRDSFNLREPSSPNFASTGSRCIGVS